MHELVHFTFKSRPLASLRLPSLAGSGLPERMRSTAFALLGLTAAAGLALVAIFAQPGFPLLEPVPLPNEPPPRQGVAEALALPLNPSRTPLAPAAGARTAVSRPPAGGSGGGGGAEGGSEPGVAPESASAVQAPPPVAEAPEGSGGGGHGGTAPPTPAATPEPASTASTPASTPKPVKQTPEAITSSAGPEPGAAPGNSGSAAAAEHASERGIEASSKGGGPAAPEPHAAAAASTPDPAAIPGPSGQGNAYAKGQGK